MTSYVESGMHFDHVWRFVDKGDGYMDEVSRPPRSYHADVVVLIVHDPYGCGLSAAGYAADEHSPSSITSAPRTCTRSPTSSDI